jgi:hypothetical protein
MVLERQIFNVDKFIISKNELYYRSNKKIYRNDNLQYELGLDFFGEFYLNDEKIVIQSFYGDILYDNFKLKGYYNYFNQNIFSFLNSEDGNLHRIENGIDIKLELKTNFYDLGNAYTIIDNTQIHAYTLPTASSLWQFNLGSLETFYDDFNKVEKQYEVSKFLGVWQEELLVVCSNGLILCLNIKTGAEVRRFHQCPTYQLGSKTNNFFDSSDVFQLDETSNKLIALYAYFYMEIDLFTNEISICNLDDEMVKKQIELFQKKFGLCYRWRFNLYYWRSSQSK